MLMQHITPCFFEKNIRCSKGGPWAGLFLGGGRFRYIYPVSDTTWSTFVFGNGTTAAFSNIALVKGDFKGL
jgi:hypothetical protein